MSFGDEIIKVLDALAAKFGIIIDWTNTNIIPYLQTLCEKYISWEISISIMWIIIGCIFLISGIIFIICEIKNDWVSEGVLMIIGVICSLIGICVVGTQVYDIITCLYFPEKQIFEYIQSLIENN